MKTGSHTAAERQTKMARQDSPQPFHDGCLPHEVTSDLLPLPIVHAHGGDQLQHHDLPTIPVLQHGSVKPRWQYQSVRMSALSSVFTSHHAVIKPETVAVNNGHEPCSVNGSEPPPREGLLLDGIRLQDDLEPLQYATLGISRSSRYALSVLLPIGVNWCLRTAVRRRRRRRFVLGSHGRRGRRGREWLGS